MKKIVFLLLNIFLGFNAVFAQNGKFDQGGHGDVPFQKPDEVIADIIVWVSVAVVVVTLVLTLKYLFMPKENDPNHIKNIIKDEGF
ncbi:MAG TPA: hypothetical protein VK021_03700 [Flavobacteriaceae bacterium]|nr:hypothetical protein [Flavobacteriaceae bacterium]